MLVAQMEVPPEVVLRAWRSRRERDPALVNLAPPFEVRRALLEMLDPLVVNEHEAAFLLGERVEGVGGRSKPPRGFCRWGRDVVVTLGEDGAVFSGSEPTEHLPAPRVDVVDTTGAGDAFVGALAAKLADDAPLRDAVAYAVRAGGAAVTKEGSPRGALPTTPRRWRCVVERWRLCVSPPGRPEKKTGPLVASGSGSKPAWSRQAVELVGGEEPDAAGGEEALEAPSRGVPARRMPMMASRPPCWRTR